LSLFENNTSRRAFGPNRDWRKFYDGALYNFMSPANIVGVFTPTNAACIVSMMEIRNACKIMVGKT